MGGDSKTSDVPIQVLVERFDGFKVWLSERFTRIDERLDTMCANSGVVAQRVQTLETWRHETVDPELARMERVSELETWRQEEAEPRFDKVDNLSRDLKRVATVLSPVIAWALTEIVKTIVNAISTAANAGGP